MISMQPQFIFISGGYDCNLETLNEVERYDCMADKWEGLAFLNIERSEHSSCIIGNTLYVLGEKTSFKQQTL